MSRQHHQSTSVTHSSLSNTHNRIVKDILHLYDSTIANEQLDRLFLHHSPNCQFEDPFALVTNLDNYRVQFHLLRWLFHSFQPNIDDAPPQITDNVNRIVIDFQPNYNFGPKGLLVLKLRTITILYLERDENGFERIIKHEDIIRFTDFIKTLPVVGILYTTSKRVFGSVTSRLFDKFILARAAK